MDAIAVPYVIQDNAQTTVYTYIYVFSLRSSCIGQKFGPGDAQPSEEEQVIESTRGMLRWKLPLLLTGKKCVLGEWR